MGALKLAALRASGLKARRLPKTYSAALVLLIVLNIAFFQCIWGHRTLLESARDAPSILFRGAYTGQLLPESKFNKVLDPGAPAWLSEPWLAFIQRQYFKEKTLPLWNPYQGFGAPFAANMQSQPFFPLTLALTLHLTPRTYNWYLLSRLFIAGFCSYLYLRLFLSFYPALAGGIASMLAGYFVLYISMPHLSVEMLLPAGLLAGEYFLRKRIYRSFLIFAVFLLLVFLGGMPESALLLLAFLYIYFAVRILSDADLRHAWLPMTGRLAVVTVTGICLAAFFLFPFLEYAARSANSHSPSEMGGAFRGLLHDHWSVSVFTYIFPLLLGPANSNVLGPGESPLRNYFGLIAFYLIAIAVCGAFTKRGRNNRILKSLTWFFLSILLLMVLKRYGSGPVNFIGWLPVFRLLDFPKYGQALISICAAMLCAIGLERLIKKEVSVRVQYIVLGATAALIPLAFLCCHHLFRVGVLLDRPMRAMPRLAIAISTVLLIGFATGLIYSNRRAAKPLLHGRLGIFAVTFLTLELLSIYILPVYHLLNRLPRSTSNPYAGAPFIDVLRTRSTSKDRIFGREGVLMPNWASAFGLYDVRNIDGMYNRKYFPFLQNFFPSWRTYTPDLSSCFRGLGSYSFKDPLERRFLQLSSVRYIATATAYSRPNKRIEEAYKHGMDEHIPGEERHVGLGSFTINHSARETLREHPPFARFPYAVTVPESSPTFYFSYGLDSATFDKAGDGVGFTVEVRESSGRITKLFSEYIDPKHEPSQRRWMNGEVDLSRFKGQSIELLFSTDPGPKNDSTYDWAGWSSFYFAGDRQAESMPFSEVYDGDAKVFEFDDVLPRAAIYYHADLAKSDRGVLSSLAAPGFSVFEDVALNASLLNEAQVAALNEMNRSAPRRVSPATITSYRSQSVTIDAVLDSKGILMLNDTGDPDWTVRVDGHPAKWFPADYLFRGVLLDSGRHLVEFLYRPKAFYIGAALSVAAAIFLAGIALRRSLN